MQNINLIPEKEVQEQTQVKVVKFSTWFSVFFMIVVGGVAGYYFYINQNINSQIDSLNKEITEHRQRIVTLAQVEVSARNLDQKFTILQDIFSSRAYYSLLSTELISRSPEGISIDSMTIQKGGKINLTGHADNYLAIANFTNNLLDTDYQKGDAALKKLFRTVTLNSVSLEKNRNVVSYSINVEIDTKLLNKK